MSALLTHPPVLHNGGVTPSSHVRVRLFGRPSVESDGTPVPLRGAFPAAVVARLALADGGTVSSDQLVGELWESPPETALGTLRANISRLRAAGLDGAIRGGRGGYALAIAAADVDVLEFRRAAEAALASGELADLEAADALWGGDPLRDVDAPFATTARAALEDLRRRAAEALAALRIESGDIPAALDSLVAVAAQHPLHEEPVRLLALALSRSGRSAEAIERIDAFAGSLAESSGLDVSPNLVALRLAILRHDPEVGAAALAEVVRHGVPLPITRFVGRSRELELLAQARRDSRLVTLTGPGGVGKSRLAVESLHVDDVDAEQWMLELAPLSTPESVDLALAALVSVTNPTRQAIAGRLAGAGSLLVLDNAEHLRDHIASLVAELLAMSPGLSVLVTSREPLRIPGERLVPVATMLESDAADAVELFRQRAVDAHPGFVLDAVTVPLVHRLVELLDGIPLALELTAARLDVMELAELARSLEAEELLLLGGPGSGRHASLNNTIAWSARLLSAQESELLAQLAGFAGAVPLDAVAGVCDLGGSDVREVATSLAQKSLLAVEDGAGSARRYRLLEAVKLYARNLERRDDTGAWLERHARWFADWVDERESRLHGARSTPVHAEFDSVRPDLLQAMATAVELGDRGVAVRLAGGQAWHWFIRGSMVESKRWIDAALALPGNPDPFFDARAVWGAVMLVYRSGDKFGGEAYALAGLPLAEQSGDPTLQALFRACNGMWSADHGRPDADELMDSAEALLSAVQPWARGEVHIFRSIFLLYRDRRADSLHTLHEAARVAVETGNTWAAGAAAWRVALLLIRLHREAEAVDQLVAVVDTVSGQGDVLALILGVHAAALAATGLDRSVEAARLFGAVDHLGVQYGFEREAVNDEAHEQYRRRARQALTPREWNPAYTEGMRMTLEEALAALRALARRPRR